MSAKIMHQGIVEAFAYSTNSSGEPITFESSAVYVDSDHVYMVSDKPQPEGLPSPMIKFPKTLLSQKVIKKESISWVNSVAINNAKKIEAITKTSDGKYIIATTDFEWLLPDSVDADAYNTILSWPTGRPSEATILHASERDGVISSRELHEKFKRVLMRKEFPNGPPYFKIEGLAALPGNRLVFGVREIGESYKNPLFTFILIEAQIQETISGLKLGKFNVIYEYNPNNEIDIEYPIGLSSLEYDPIKNGLYLLTSFEVGENMGGYIWFLPMKAIGNYDKPSLIKDSNGKPIQFEHKSEGLWLLDDNTVLVVHDDDRKKSHVAIGETRIQREVNQGIFSIVKLR